MKEVTLLGQIVDRYGKDFDDGPDLSDLLRVINGIDGIERIRFLTSHPNWMNDELLDTVAELPKVCEHIEVPVQAGDDEVLRRMKRGYTADDYRRLIEKIRRTAQHLDRHRHHRGLSRRNRNAVPGDVRSTGRTQTRRSASGEVSTRPGTVAARNLGDDVSGRRERAPLATCSTINTRGFPGRSIAAPRIGGGSVWVEVQHKGKWRGRTRTNKLVFFDDAAIDRRGQLVNVQIDKTGPWSMSGTINNAQ